MGRERFLFVPFPLPCGSALWDPDLSGRKSWRYSPECVELEFSEVHIRDPEYPSPSGRAEPLSTALNDRTLRHLATRMDEVAGFCIE
jgi:hypothetical protein